MTVSGDADIDGSGLAWLERSYDQVLGKNTTSRFMKPKCLYRMETSTEDDDSDDSDDDVVGYQPLRTLELILANYKDRRRWRYTWVWTREISENHIDSKADALPDLGNPQEEPRAL